MGAVSGERKALAGLTANVPEAGMNDNYFNKKTNILCG